MKILIIGSGGREHALAWKLSQSKHSTEIYVAPGNAGTAKEKNTFNVEIQADDISALIQFAKDKPIDLTIVGPELPLSLGIVDDFENAGLSCLGPKKQCAQLESSKAYSKNFMTKYNIPTARYQNFTNSTKAKAYASEMPLPIVVKADGLAAGKGVIIAKTIKEAFSAIDQMLDDNKFGSAGSKIVIEECLIGQEASFIVLSDGSTALAMASSQDHKARDNGDKGPNTGGMGAYSPAPIVTQSIHHTIMQNIIQPVIDGMKSEGTPYKGFLYAGVMIMPDGNVKTLEFNCRLGDPETQPIMMRLESDLLEMSLAALDGALNRFQAKWRQQYALGVVMAAKGYPGSYPRQEKISGTNSDNGITNKIFHAGTYRKNADILTCGGRILCVTALGKTVENAHKNAYDLVKKISWQNEYHRDDIGSKAFAEAQIGENGQVLRKIDSF